MNGAEFIERLRAGLRGMQPGAADDIIADYEAHFEHARAEGRNEAEVAAALGDPARLARELRAEAQFKNYEQTPSASRAAGAVLALIGLGALDIIILAILLWPVLGILIAWLAVGICGFIGGIVVLIVCPFIGGPGGALAALLGGLGLVAGSAASLALLTLLCIGLTHLAVWYGRLHFQALKPAIGEAA